MRRDHPSATVKRLSGENIAIKVHFVFYREMPIVRTIFLRREADVKKIHNFKVYRILGTFYMCQNPKICEFRVHCYM